MTDANDAARSTRDQIDRIDEAILDNAAQRKALGEDIIRLKSEAGARLRDGEREREVIERYVRLGRERGLSEDICKRLAALMIEESVKRQRGAVDAKAASSGHNVATVAYLGGPGTYSHDAANAHFADRYHAIQPVPCRDFPAIIRSVEAGEADYGFLPIENTTTGGISEVYDLLLDSKLTIVGEHHLKVEHCLVGRGASPASVRTVHGHPQALGQSQRYFKKRPDITTHYVSSTTRALQLAMEGDETIGAVAGASAAELYGLNVLERGIADHAENYTRFLAVALEAAPPPETLDCKTTVVFSTPDQPGALVKVLNAFADAGVNIAKLESRPIPGNPWEEKFFIDIEGHQGSAEMQAGLKVLEETCRDARVLGSYGADRFAAAAD